MQLTKNQMIAIGVLAVAVVAVAAAAVMFNNGGNGGNGGGSSDEIKFQVDSAFANEAPTVMHCYVTNSDASEKICVDEAGLYIMPSNPVYRIEIIDEKYTAGMFGDDLIIYTSSFESDSDDYDLCVDFNGATNGTMTIDGSVVTIPLTVTAVDKVSYSGSAASGYDFVYYNLETDDDGDGEYTHLDSKFIYSHTVPSNPFTTTIPAGKAFDYWSYNKDGSGTHVEVGATIPYATAVYAILKDA